MVLSANVSKINSYKELSFGKNDDKKVEHEGDLLMYNERRKHPVTTALKIQADKFSKACTEYPVKGFSGSKNANFYEFLTMGMVPYLTGSAMIVATFNLASKFFDTPAAKCASKLGKKMGIGVIGYGLAKTFSKKLIETPLNLKYGIDVNLPYEKNIHELPENRNKNNLKTREFHKAYESVDFPRWDLFYNNKDYGEDRNAYYEKVGKKMGLTDEQLKQADQEVKPLIKEKVVKTKLFSTLSSYLWAACAVGIAMQKPWEDLPVNPIKIVKNYKNNAVVRKSANEVGIKAAKYNWFKDFGSRFVSSCKEFVNSSQKSHRIAGRALLASAVLLTGAGIFSTLNDFNINRRGKSQGATPLFDEDNEKVVC